MAATSELQPTSTAMDNAVDRFTVEIIKCNQGRQEGESPKTCSMEEGLCRRQYDLWVLFRIMLKEPLKDIKVF